MTLRFALLFSLLLSSRLVAGEASITINAAKDRGPVRQAVFGQNFECGDSRGLFSLPADAPEPRALEVTYAQGYWDPVGRKPAQDVVDTMKRFPFGALRYPGGCLAHNFRWKESIGPVEQRGSKIWEFGLDEYLRLCEALNCEPQIIVTDYGLACDEIPRDAADLVEYLNMPATPQYPWAQRRAANGRPEPYHVKYFEIGNESIHGNHANKPFRRYTPEQYVKYFNATVGAMKKVDPSILAGYVMDDAGGSWDPIVARGCAAAADFAIVHSYYPQVDSMPPQTAFNTAMAGGEQFSHRLEAYRKLIRLGGKELPLALTEFNFSSTSPKPDAYRFSFFAGLANAETWCRLLQPEENILLANYWYLLNGMYGVITTIPGKIPENYTGKPTGFKAAARFFETLREFTLDTLVACSVSGSPRLEAPAAPGVLPSYGDRYVDGGGDGLEVPLAPYNPAPFRKFPELAFSGSHQDGTVAVELNRFNQEAYPAFVTVNRPASLPEGEAWKVEVSCEARFLPASGNTGTGTLGLGLMDARGWNATHCAAAVYGVNSAKEWTPFTRTLQMLDDSSQLSLLIRFQHISGALSGRLEFRNLKIKAYPAGHFPAYPALSAFASKSADGRRLGLLVFNRSYEQEIPVTLKLEDFPATRVKIVSLYQEKIESVADFTPERREESVMGNEFRCKLPPHSMTAFEFN